MTFTGGVLCLIFWLVLAVLIAIEFIDAVNESRDSVTVDEDDPHFDERI